MGPTAIDRSMYSLPSTSHTWAPRPPSRYFGAMPRTHWPGPLARVCVPAGMSCRARAKYSSDLVMDGKLRARCCLSIMRRPLFAARQLIRNGIRDRRGGQTLRCDHVRQKPRAKVAAVKAERNKRHPRLFAREGLGDDRIQAARHQVVLDG